MNVRMTFAILRNLVVIECVEIKVRHQVGFYVIDCLSKRLDEFIEVFFI
jgi:hypothetical protein